jgi:prepilin-type N-terminal cleavage/methylation domain-containing protein
MTKGFTIIEFLVVMVIIGILSAIFFLQRPQEEQKLALQRAAYQVLQNLREAQNMAMGARISQCGTFKFGIQFKLNWSNSYILFADCNNNNQRDGGDIDIKTYTLEKGVTISNLSPASSFSIVFEPPDPVVYINSKSWGEEAVITLSFDTFTKKVRINSAGMIQIE